MQETVVPAPLLVAENHPVSSVLASQGLLQSPASVEAPAAALVHIPAQLQAADAEPPSVLELSSEAPTQTLQASQEMSLVTGTLAKADAHWLRDASSLSLDEVALRLRRLDELEQQTQTYAQQLDAVKTENAALQKTAEQYLQFQYVGLALLVLFALAYAFAHLRRGKARLRPDPAASSILFGDEQSAAEELQRRATEPEKTPQAKTTAAESAKLEPQNLAALAPEQKTPAALPAQSLGAHTQVQDSQEYLAPLPKKQPWYQRLRGGKIETQAIFADSAADALALSDEERDERIDSVWEDSKDWLREERILAERDALPVGAVVPVLSPLLTEASSPPRAASESFFVDDIAPQPGQALIDYIRSLHRIVQRMLDQGQFGQAGTLLYEHVCLVPQTSPWAYLAFLSLYKEPTSKYLDMRQRFVARFGREAPEIGEEKSNLALGRGIADYQYSMAQLTQSWPSERAVLLLEEWLAVSNKRIFTLNAYNELFMLYDVLEDLHGVSHATNFQALAASPKMTL